MSEARLIFTCSQIFSVCLWLLICVACRDEPDALTLWTTVCIILMVVGIIGNKIVNYISERRS